MQVNQGGDGDGRVMNTAVVSGDGMEVVDINVSDLKLLRFGARKVKAKQNYEPEELTVVMASNDRVNATELGNTDSLITDLELVTFVNGVIGAKTMGLLLVSVLVSGTDKLSKTTKCFSSTMVGRIATVDGVDAGLTRVVL